jgi:uncharacterized repeat protein (TIGR04002 family)
MFMKKHLVLTGLLAAMIFFTTAYILHIPIVDGGYIHLGDAVLYMAAALLPMPYAMLAGVIGGGLADILTGAAMWAPFTVIIKAVMVIPFTAKKDRLLCRRNLLAPVLAGVIGMAGYYVAEVILLCLSGSSVAVAAGAALAAVPFNLGQELAGGIAFILLAAALDRLQLKARLSRI